MKNIKTITIGISAFNEEQTIGALLDSIAIQTGDSFLLEKIIINLDGSTDNTKKVITDRKDELVTIIDNKIQKGKATRLNELYQMNKSDVLIILDADITITDQRFIAKLISGFTHQNIAIVSSNNQPIKPKTFIGKIWYANEQSWYEIRKDVNNGNNLYNNSGCAVALEKNFTKSIVMPKEAIADQQFVYLSAMKQNKQFVFKENAVVYYLPPANLHDIKIQFARSLGEEKFLKQYFDERYDIYFKIPTKAKLKGLWNAFITDPFYTILSRIFLFILPKLGIEEDENNKKGLWKRTNSTKKLIN
ncbi:MAG TPA: glycosyltransferase [Candidatus Woesebacteria bacterium]|nr:glycosyltransferase [Candidatus Woesebacteria bacterium]